jgi:hypothetical protein
MVRYAYEYLTESEFEELIVAICHNVLGISAHAFAPGRDGGRDSSFSGTAANYPNAGHPWSGNFIIQAKHVNNPAESCSDNSFFANKSSLLKSEVAKIKGRKKERIDNYIVFTNRKMTGGIYPQLIEYMRSELGIQNVEVHGAEDLDNFVSKYPALVKQFSLMRNLLPDVFYEADIRNVIVLFSKNSNWMDTEPIKDVSCLDYTDKECKNALNKVNDAYFTDIKENSLKYFRDIEKFLKDPKNAEYRQMYINTVYDLRGYILRNTDKYTFVELLESIIEHIVGNNNLDIFKVRALVRVFVHFMYWECDIGKKN